MLEKIAGWRLPVACRLVGRSANTPTALVTSSGISFRGQEFATPSAAASAARNGTAANGWEYWLFEGGPLSALRWRIDPAAPHCHNRRSFIESRDWQPLRASRWSIATAFYCLGSRRRGVWATLGPGDGQPRGLTSTLLTGYGRIKRFDELSESRFATR